MVVVGVLLAVVFGVVVVILIVCRLVVLGVVDIGLRIVVVLLGEVVTVVFLKWWLFLE